MYEENNPVIKNGIINPAVQAEIKSIPLLKFSKVEIVIKIDDNAGPIQGVQEKLKVKPKIKAINGFIFFILNGIFLSFSKKLNLNIFN